METTLSTQHKAPAFDKKIADWIDEQPATMWGSVEYLIGIGDAKTVYRKIECSGMGEFVAASEFIKSLGLVEVGRVKGFDSVFAMP